MRRVTIYVAAATALFWAAIPKSALGGTGREAAGISLQIERIIAAPRETVFHLWTDPQAVAKWFLPPENAHWTEPPKFKALTGARFSLRLVSENEFYDLHGTFREVRPPEMLVLNWRWGRKSPLAGSPGNTVVTAQFLAEDEKTKIVLTQVGFRNEESRGQYERGWSRCFRQMDKLVDATGPANGIQNEEFVRVPSPLVALEHVVVIDGTGAPPKADQTLVISHGRIAALGSAGSIEVPPNAERLDLTGYTAIPGLVGMHDHLFYSSNFLHTLHADDVLAHDMPFSYPRLYLANGVTTIRTTGSFEPYADLEIKRAVDSGTLIGPKMRITGPYLEGEPFPLIQIRKLTGPDDARRMVAYWADEGATSFKLFTDVTREQAKAAIEEAHRRGLTITGHLCSIGFREAAELGIDNLEHGLWVDTEFASGKEPDRCPSTSDATAADIDIGGSAIQSLIKTLVDHRIAVTSTLAAWEQYVPSRPGASQRVLDCLSDSDRKLYRAGRLADQKKMNEGSESEKKEFERLGRMLHKEMEFERAFVRAGGLLTAGSDAVFEGDIAGFGDQRDLELLVEAGFSPEEAIRIASLNGAQFLKEADRIGSLAPGKQADIVLIKGDPSKNIRDIENVEIVFKDGLGYDSKKLIDSVKGQVGIR